MTLPLSPIAAFALALIAKATLVLAAAFAINFVLSRTRAPAATRHLVWTIAVCAVLALPLLSLALPGWRVGFITLSSAATAFDAAPVAALAPEAPIAAVAPGMPVPESAPITIISDEGAATTVVQLGTPAPLAPIAPPADVAPVIAAPSLAGIGGGGNWLMMIALVWAGVAAILLARIALGRASVRRLGRHAQPVTDPEWTGLVRDLAWTLGIDRPVALLRGGSATMPMTWGILHPTILLPAESAVWTTDRIRVVLLHELAHVARHDCLTQTLASIACALYWFHPASWHAARRLRVERELACDDRVLAAGTRAREYAAHLLEVARDYRAPRLAGAAAIGMARPSQLEGRLLAVLDAVRDRSTVSPRSAVVSAAMAAVLILPLAAMRPAEAATMDRLPAVSAEAPRAPVEPTPVAVGDANCALTRVTGFECLVDARAGERLTLEIQDGISVRVTGRDRGDVFVHSDDGGRRMDVTAERVNGGVRVTARAASDVRRGSGPDILIEVPTRFNVHVAGDDSGIEIREMTGAFTGSTRGGRLAFVRAGGTVRMDAAGGGALVSESHLEGEVEMAGGGVVIDGNRGNLNFPDAASIVYGSNELRRRGMAVESGSDVRVVEPGGGTRAATPAEAARANYEVDRARAEARAGESLADVAVSATSGRGRSADGRGVAVVGTSGRGRSGDGGGVTVVGASGRGRAASGRGAAAAGTGDGAEITCRSDDCTLNVEAVGRGATTRRADAVSSSRSATTGAGDTWRVSSWSRDGATVGADGEGYAYATGDAAGRIDAIRAMARYAPADAAAQGIARLALEDRDERVQRAAVDALAGLRGSARDQQLRRIARDHRSAEIRRRATAALR